MKKIILTLLALGHFSATAQSHSLDLQEEIFTAAYTIALTSSLEQSTIDGRIKEISFQQTSMENCKVTIVEDEADQPVKTRVYSVSKNNQKLFNVCSSHKTPIAIARN